MTRKDSEKDSDRPHYYSQFWLDVAAGRRVIGAPKPEENEGIEPELPEPTPAPRRAPRLAQNDLSNGRTDAIVHPVAEPITTPDAFIEPDIDDFSETEDQEFQAPVEDADIPDVIGDFDEEEEDEESFGEEEEEEEEEEDDIGWGSARGRKKPRPVRPAKPAPKKPGRREPRRGY
ncbi:MAG TPA: hypothetical protein VGN34_22250 [Ktedonobacteraceae bacterium]|jgi:hypothetical protein